MDEAKKDIARLERLVVQAGGSPGLTLATRDIKIKEGGVIPAAGGKTKLKKDMVGVSRIIWIMIIFAGVISFLFYMLWWMQIKKKEQEKLHPLEKTPKTEAPK